MDGEALQTQSPVKKRARTARKKDNVDSKLHLSAAVQDSLQSPPIQRRRRKKSHTHCQTEDPGCLAFLKNLQCSFACGGTTCSVHETNGFSDSSLSQSTSSLEENGNLSLPLSTLKRKRKDRSLSSAASPEKKLCVSEK